MLNNILYNLPLVLSVFCLVYVFISRVPENKIARKALMIYIFNSLLLFLIYAVSMQESQMLYIYLKPLWVTNLVSVFPLYYIYVRLSAFDIVTPPRYLLVYIPALMLGAMMALALMLLSADELNLVMQYERVGDKLLSFSDKANWVFRLEILVSCTIVLQIGLIVYNSIREIRKIRRRCNPTTLPMVNYKIKGLVYEISFIVIVAILVAFVILITGIDHFSENTLLLFATAAFATSPMLIITFQPLVSSAFNRSEGLVRATDANISTDKIEVQSELSDMNVEDNALSDVDGNLSLISARIVEVMENQELFLQSELRITDICEVLQVNRTYISRAINQCSGGNFTDFVNGYRVQYAKELLSKPSAATAKIDRLAVKSGFKNSAAMSRAFKKAENLTPVQFRAQVLNL